MFQVEEQHGQDPRGRSGRRSENGLSDGAGGHAGGRDSWVRWKMMGGVKKRTMAPVRCFRKHPVFIL